MKGRINHMEKDKQFSITYWAGKHKKHITRRGQWKDGSRYWTSRSGTNCLTYFDLDSGGYRTATTAWKVSF